MLGSECIDDTSILDAAARRLDTSVSWIQGFMHSFDGLLAEFHPTGDELYKAGYKVAQRVREAIE